MKQMIKSHILVILVACIHPFQWGELNVNLYFFHCQQHFLYCLQFLCLVRYSCYIQGFR